MPGLSGGANGLTAFDASLFWHQPTNFTLTDNNSAQKCFNVGTAAGAAMTVSGGMVYGVEAALAFTNTGTTAHTWAFLFGGTATFTANSLLLFSGQSAASAAPATGGLQGSTTTPNVATVFTASSTSATENVSLFISGTVTINAAGTLIPQIQLSAATTGTEVALAGNWIRIFALGPTGVPFAGAVA